MAPAGTLNTLTFDEEGATAIEYGLIAGLVVIALIAALYNMNATMNGLYSVIIAISETL
jgi:Flp pilus assembly pilin Flp